MEQFSDEWLKKYAFKLNWLKTFHDENGNEAKDDGSIIGKKMTSEDDTSLVYAWLKTIPHAS